MPVLRALLGLVFFCAVSWALSSHRRRFPTRVVVFGIALQVVLGAFLLRTELGVALFQSIADFVQKLISMTADGTQLIFGELSKPNFDEGGWGYAFAFASNGLPVIIFFGALMAVLYHLGIMQLVIYAMARVMTAIMGVSGAEAMSMASNVFVGQTEAPLIVKPYIARMTPSELNALMTGGFATIAGSVLAVYMGMLGPEAILQRLPPDRQHIFLTNGKPQLNKALAKLVVQSVVQVDGGRHANREGGSTPPACQVVVGPCASRSRILPIVHGSQLADNCLAILGIH